MAKTGAFQPSALCPQAGFFQQPVSDSRLSERIREPQPALSDPGQYRRHDAIAARRVELEGASRHLTDARDQVATGAFQFPAPRCDRVVAAVLARVAQCRL